MVLHPSSHWTTEIATIVLLSLCAGTSCLSPPNSDVIYDDLVQLHATCHGLDSCQGNRYNDDLRYVNCQCGPQCVAFGTCCMDSEHRKRPQGAGGTVGFKCRKPYGVSKPVFMVQGCRVDSDDFAREQCFGDGQASDDPMLLIPTTSLRTGYTDRNYFCYACNEDPTSYWAILWDLKLISLSPNITEYSLSDLHYDEMLWSWAFRGTNVTVFITMETPDAASPYVTHCRLPVVDTCPESWSDPDTRKKCGSYMALIYDQDDKLRQTLYRNPHCAVCNSVSRLSCSESVTHTQFRQNGPLFVRLVSLEHKLRKCPSRMLYDKLSNKCRIVRCGKRKKFVKGICRYSYS